ncbi:2-keto-4-pentenoate hydratase [Streptomyces antibioticus]|nr:fumarylacetoacetate hydrolase family protein [Streptomyces antibioticus]KUN29675.1 2-keto-4-pentenoate hydratase [Streptomyces antibioticus]
MPIPTESHTANWLAAADRLAAAASSGTPCDPVRDLIGAQDLDAAYAVQSELIERRLTGGARIVGRKIGLTAPAVQQQFGVHQPDFGVLLDDMIHADSAVLPLGDFIAPRVEGEIAFVLGADLDNPRTTVVDVLRATQYLLPAIEVVDSRIRGWDISLADTVADNASSGAVVLGTTAYDPVGLDLTEVAMTLEHAGEPVSTGTGAACLGSPVNAVVWLARECAARGRPLASGEVVLSGALGPMVQVDGPGHHRVDISGLGHVAVHFEETA